MSNEKSNKDYTSEQDTIIHLALETSILQAKIYKKILKNIINPLAKYLTANEAYLDQEQKIILEEIRIILPELWNELEKSSSNITLIEFMNAEIESRKK